MLAIRTLFGYTKYMETGARTRRIHLRPRLAAAAELLGQMHTVADIGCDHGRLSAALLQSGAAARVIAVDVSAASLKKASELSRYIGLDDRMDVRLGDGLSALSRCEADGLALCGMGGMLMAELLGAAAIPLMGAMRAVFQPMRGIAEIRKYLFLQGFRIERDVVVPDSGRLYQVFSAVPGQDTLPPGWPEGCFELGYRAINDPHFGALAQSMLAQHEKRLSTARGTRGAALLEKKAENMRRVLALHHA